MKCQMLSFLVVALATTVTTVKTEMPCRAAEPEKMLSHDVYFSLTDNSPESKEKLVAACRKYLSGHPGTIWFAAGPLGEEFQRDVNDRDFDVALHLVFKNKAAHDEYAKAERHLKFIEETKPNWKKVRVFDSYVAVSSHEGVAMEGEKAGNEKKLPLPDAAAGFAGMIQGKVAKTFDGGIVLNVTQVAKEWEHNKAKGSQRLVGKMVAVVVGKGEVNILRFVNTLKVGEEVSLDVAHKGGEALTILELTEDQRERAKKVSEDK